MPGLIHESAIERLRTKYGTKLETKRFRARLDEEILKSTLSEFYPHAKADKEYAATRGDEPADDMTLEEFHFEFCLSCCLKEYCRGVLPDAFMIEQSGEPCVKGWSGQLTIFEVEDGHPVGPEKLQKYIDLFWNVLDPEYWNPPKFVAVDRLGNESEHCLIYDIDINLKTQWTRDKKGNGTATEVTDDADGL